MRRIVLFSMSFIDKEKMMARIRCGVPLLVMGAVALGTPFVFPVGAGKATESARFLSAPALPACAMPSQPRVHHSKSRSVSQVQPFFQVDNNPAFPMPMGGQGSKRSSQPSSRVPNSQDTTQPSVQMSGIVQTQLGSDPDAAQEVSSQEIARTQQPAQLADDQDTSIGVSGPFSASIAWGIATPSATVPAQGARSLSVTFTAGDSPTTQDSGYQIKLDWGDGTTANQVIGKHAPNKSFHVSSTHIYHNSGTFPVHLTISDGDGSQVTATQSVVVP